MESSREHLEQLRTLTQGNLEHFERQAAGFGPLNVPVQLKNQIDATVNELASIDSRLAQLSGTLQQSVIDHLPRYNQAFVGRQAELAECLKALQPSYRGWGVTIDGLGGMGKTALAVEAALHARQAVLFDAYLFCSAKTTWLGGAGVREVTLAHSSLDAFVREFARQLKLEAVSRTTATLERRQAFLAALAGRSVLLIWDNLETLIAEERQLISEFLNLLPGANKAIVTSRKRTGDSAMTIRLDRMSEIEARDLINDLATRNPRLRSEIRAAPQLIREIYAAAGGSPLVISWTLGRVDQLGLSLPQALAHLRDGERSADLYRFLFEGLAQELSADDSRTLVTLATFYAPASRAALCDVTGLTERTCGFALERLISRSLVNDLENETYALHPITRSYVRATLEQPADASGNVRLDPAALRRALRYWVDFAKQYGAKNHETYDRLEATWISLETAARDLHALALDGAALRDREAAAMLNELVRALRDFTNTRGLWDERIDLNGLAYAAMICIQNWRAAGWRAYDQAFTYHHRGETEQGAYWANAAEQAWIRGGDESDQAEAKRLLGMIAQQCGELERAQSLYSVALQMYRRLRERTNEATVLSDLAGIAHLQSDYPQAEQYYRQALAICEGIGDVSSISLIYANLGNSLFKQGKLVSSRQAYERGLELARQVRRDEVIAAFIIRFKCCHIASNGPSGTT